MRRLVCLLFLIPYVTQADTIDHYMNIVNNIPKMEMQADPQSQAWARSARNILALTSESIGETLTMANDAAKARGVSLFCLPPGKTLSAEFLNELIQQTYREISAQHSDQTKMSVSQVALIGIGKQYPCQPNQSPRLEMFHEHAAPESLLQPSVKQ